MSHPGRGTTTASVTAPETGSRSSRATVACRNSRIRPACAIASTRGANDVGGLHRHRSSQLSTSDDTPDGVVGKPDPAAEYSQAPASRCRWATGYQDRSSSWAIGQMVPGSQSRSAKSTSSSGAQRPPQTSEVPPSRFCRTASTGSWEPRPVTPR